MLALFTAQLNLHLAFAYDVYNLLMSVSFSIQASFFTLCCKPFSSPFYRLVIYLGPLCFDSQGDLMMAGRVINTCFISLSLFWRGVNGAVETMLFTRL